MSRLPQAYESDRIALTRVKTALDDRFHVRAQVRAMLLLRVYSWRDRVSASEEDLTTVISTLGLDDQETRTTALNLAWKLGQVVICNSCRMADHENCDTLVDSSGERRTEPAPGWCFCQHRPSAVAQTEPIVTKDTNGTIADELVKEHAQ